MENLIIVREKINFSEALRELKAKKFIKVPEWEGYWFLKGGKIKVMTAEGVELDTPWLQETVLREDWQVVSKKFMNEIDNTELHFVVDEAKVDRVEKYSIMDNSDAFRAWLDFKKISWDANGHATIVYGFSDVFHLGKEFEKYRAIHQK